MHANSIPNPDGAENPLLVRVSEALRLLGIGRTTLYKLINDHVLAVVKIRGGTRIARSSIDEYITKSTI
jgi:excisionase family DNA binding protein